jgi:aspartate racemase
MAQEATVPPGPDPLPNGPSKRPVRSEWRQEGGMAERLLGLVGGIGPESTLDYYRRLLDGYHERVGPSSHPPLLINSLDGGPLIGPLMTGDGAPMAAAVRGGIERLAAGGAGLGLICSVAGHAIFDEVVAVSPIPLLSIVQATRRAAIAAGTRRPALFGTRISVEGAYFARPFEDAGIELVRPSEADRGWIHDMYLGELVNGVFLESSRERLLAILAGLRRDQGVDGLILGGTELSLILPATSYDGLPVLNAAAIHVAEALDWLAGGEPPGPEG